MDGLTHCPSCNVILRVPRNSCGHRVRCPSCNAISTVPDAQSLNDETISSWIEMDVDATFAQRDEMAVMRYMEQHSRRAQDIDSNGGTATQTQEVSCEHKHDRNVHHTKPSANDHDLYDIRTDQPVASTKQSKPPSDDLPSLSDTSRLTALTGEVSEQETVPVSSQVTKPEKRPSVEPAAKGVEHVDRPLLLVNGISSMGVRLTFDSRWMTWEGFRLSLPVQCVFSGEMERSKLIARPLVFPDRSLSRQASAQRLAAEHERRELKSQGPREWVKKMGLLELMPKPFDLIMPYYVSTKYAHLSLHCVTHDHRDDRITCDVLIPHPPSALEWFARVNGVCGEDYLALEHEVHLLHGDNWRNLSDTARQRILVWCKLVPNEQFRAYFNDADHGALDEGLAGIVLTNRRLIYCKYHSKGKVPLETDKAVIHAQKEGNFVHLTLHLPDRNARMVKLKMEDFEQLQAQVHANGTLAFKIIE